MRMAKTKALISFAVTAKLIRVFVSAYAKSRFSHDEAHIVKIGEIWVCIKMVKSDNFQDFSIKSYGVDIY